MSLLLLQTLTFEEDETEKNVTFTLLDDILPEDNENFQLRLGGVMGGATIGNISTSELYMAKCIYACTYVALHVLRYDC